MTIPHKRKAAPAWWNEKSGRKGASEHGTNEELSRRGESEEREMGEAIDINGLPVPMEKRARVSTQFSEPNDQPHTLACPQSPGSITWRSTKSQTPTLVHLAPAVFLSAIQSAIVPGRCEAADPARTCNNASVAATLRISSMHYRHTTPSNRRLITLALTTPLKLGTQINPLSLTISTDEEYFLFMTCAGRTSGYRLGCQRKRWVELPISTIEADSTENEPNGYPQIPQKSTRPLRKARGC